MAAAKFNAVVIGTGQAGPALAPWLSGAGGKVAVVEKDKFGGTCVNNGCTPTKAMVASAYAAHIARRAREYGVLLDAGPRVEMKPGATAPPISSSRPWSSCSAWPPWCRGRACI